MNFPNLRAQSSLTHSTLMKLFLKSCLFLQSNSGGHILLLWDWYFQDLWSEKCSPIPYKSPEHRARLWLFLSGVYRWDRPATHSFLVSGLACPVVCQPSADPSSCHSLWFHKNLFPKYSMENFSHYSLLHKRLKD